MSFLRAIVVRPATRLCNATRPSIASAHIPLPAVCTATRSYASKKHKDVESDKGKDLKSKIRNTDDLVPGSQRILLSPEYTTAETKMKASLEFFRKEVAALEVRASGRITASVLSPVRVILPDNAGADGKGLKLEEIATVGVRDGTILMVTVFQDNNLKHVEHAIYDAKLPGIIPQRVDARTIKIPTPKPTVEARVALYGTAHRQAEDSRAQIRKCRDAVAKGFKKHQAEYEEYQKLMERYIGEVDKVLAGLKKFTGAK